MRDKLRQMLSGLRQGLKRIYPNRLGRGTTTAEQRKNEITDPDYEDWIEGFGMIPFTEEELLQIKSGQKPIGEVDLRNLVREILHLRWLSVLLLKRCEELGDNEEGNALIKIARFNLLEGPRSQGDSSQ